MKRKGERLITYQKIEAFGQWLESCERSMETVKKYRHYLKQFKEFIGEEPVTKEMVLFKGVLQEGKDKGVFHIDDVDMTASLVHYCVKGIEVPYIRGHIGANLDMETRKKYVANIVFGALHRTEI